MSGMQTDENYYYYYSSPEKKQRLGYNNLLYGFLPKTLQDSIHYYSYAADPTKTVITNNEDFKIIQVLPTLKNGIRVKNNLNIGLPLTDENDRANFMAPDHDFEECNNIIINDIDEISQVQYNTIQ